MAIDKLIQGEVYKEFGIDLANIRITLPDIIKKIRSKERGKMKDGKRAFLQVMIRFINGLVR